MIIAIKISLLTLKYVNIMEIIALECPRGYLETPRDSLAFMAAMFCWHLADRGQDATHPA